MNSTAQLNMIVALDLSPIKTKLMHKESGEGWTREQANAVEFEYRRFLCLMKLYPHEQIAPRFDVDIFWHYHILDTMKYAADCKQVFGYFLHHYPYSGLQGEADDEAVHLQLGARMQELYEATFGEAYIRQEQPSGVPSNKLAETTASAWCQGAMATSAWCQGTMSTTAWCQGVMTKSAWCQGAMTKSAWCQGVMEKTSWCQGVMTQAAWCQGAMAIVGRRETVAQNDAVYSRESLAMAA